MSRQDREKASTPGREDKICRICEKELSDPAYANLIQIHISQIPEELRTSDEILQSRLKICSECEYIRNGMCRMCGCFVEIKASRKNSSCPLIPARWRKEDI